VYFIAKKKQESAKKVEGDSSTMELSLQGYHATKITREGKTITTQVNSAQTFVYSHLICLSIIFNNMAKRIQSSTRVRFIIINYTSCPGRARGLLGLGGFLLLLIGQVLLVQLATESRALGIRVL